MTIMKDFIPLEDNLFILTIPRRGKNNQPYALFIDRVGYFKMKSKVTSLRINPTTKGPVAMVKLNGQEDEVRLSRFLKDVSDPNFVIDHLNDNTLDYRLDNLYVAQNGHLHSKAYKKIKKPQLAKRLQPLPNLDDFLDNVQEVSAGIYSSTHSEEVISMDKKRKSLEGSPNPLLEINVKTGTVTVSNLDLTQKEAKLIADLLERLSNFYANPY